MATNHYVDHYQNRTEQTLVEDLTIEAIKFYGVDVIYMPRESLERDDIFGEDIRTKFDDNHMIEMYLQSVDGWEGEGDFLAKFGLVIKNSATFIMARRRFEEVIPHKERPLEGDLIYFPLSNSVFEIKYVDHENPFYQIGKLHTYSLQCELFVYSHEEFETGHQVIDNIVPENDNDINIAVADNDEIQDETLTTVDFTEDNPFGDF